MKNRIISIIIVTGMFFTSVCGCSRQDVSEVVSEKNTIQATQEDPMITESDQEFRLEKAIPWEMGWLVIGSQGTLIQVQPDGTFKDIETGSLSDFQDICFDGQSLWIVGTDGCVLKGTKTLSFQEIDAVSDEDFYACQSFADTLFLGGSGKTLWTISGSDEIKPCNLRFEGTMMDMEASDELCIFVTDRGESFSTNDGLNWNLLSYEEYYGKSVSFQGMIYDGHNFWVHGITDAGTELFYTSSGTVWGERDINYLDGADADLSDIQILSLTTDGSQLYAWCDDGYMITIPDCVKCNKKTEVKNVSGGTIGYNGGNLLMIADTDKMEIMETELAKQYQISAETAYSKTKEGAVLIDVRSQEDYDKKHITGSVLIPLDELEEKLSQLYPDIGQTVIFYCAKGVRSQTAVEKAVALGYVEVYSLGSIDNWEYEFEEQE